MIKIRAIFDQSFDVLSGCHHHAFDIHFQQMPQAKPPQPVKLFRFSEQRLNPHAAFAHRFLIRFGLAIGFGFVELFLEEGAEDEPAALARRAFAFHRTATLYDSFALFSPLSQSP